MLIESMIKLTDGEIQPPSTKNDLDELGKALEEMDTIKNLGTMYQAKILYHVHKNWDDIDMAVTGFWQYDFYKWAKSFGQNYNAEQAKTTIDNKIAVYRDYVAEELIETPEYVLIDKKQVRFDIMMCSYTKLLNVRIPARSGKLTPEMWSMVYDKSVSVSQLSREIKDIKNENEVSLFSRDGLIFASDGTDMILIGHIDYEDKDKSLWQIGLEKLSKFCKIDELIK